MGKVITNELIRLKDAIAAIKDCYCDCCEFEDNECEKMYCDVHGVIRNIENIAVVNYAPRHGEWISKEMEKPLFDGVFECSVC